MTSKPYAFLPHLTALWRFHFLSSKITTGQHCTTIEMAFVSFPSVFLGISVRSWSLPGCCLSRPFSPQTFLSLWPLSSHWPLKFPHFQNCWILLKFVNELTNQQMSSSWVHFSLRCNCIQSLQVYALLWQFIKRLYHLFLIPPPTCLLSYQSRMCVCVRVHARVASAH